METNFPVSWKKSAILLAGRRLTSQHLMEASNMQRIALYAAGTEIGNGSGETKDHFDEVARDWRHSALHTHQKIRIVQTCVVPKLL